MAQAYKEPIEITSVDKLHVGDVIQVLTMTYSQKWTIQPGFDEYNSLITGKVIRIGPAFPQCDVIILKGAESRRKNNGEVDPLVHDPGTSGCYNVYVIQKATE